MSKKWSVLLIMFIPVIAIFANGLSLNSPGPRALGMGGAFVGLADDASAIYWNPAALAMQGSSFKAILTDIVPITSYKADGTDYPGWNSFGISRVDALGKKNHYFNPNLFLNYRKEQWAFGLGIYVPAGLGAEYEGKELASLVEYSGGINGFTGEIANKDDIEWVSKIGVLNFSPAVAYQLTDKMAIGAALNIYYGMFELKRLQWMNVVHPLTGETLTNNAYQYSEDSDGIGIGATFSVKYNVNEKLSSGLTVRLPTTVTMSGEAKNDGMVFAGTSAKSDFDRDVTWPLWLGIGFAYNITPRTVLTFDAQYSQWGELDQLETKFKDEVWKTITSHHDENLFVLDWEDRTQIRFGARHFTSETFAIYGGYYYDPAPAPDNRLNILFPSSTNHVVTSGFCYTFGNMEIDFGIEYLFGGRRDVEADFKSYDDGQKLMNHPGRHHLDVFAFSLGWGIHF